MEKIEFVVSLFGYYNQSMETEQGKLRVKYLSKWLDGIEQKEYDELLQKTLDEFKPTGVNPMPLIPHLKELYTDSDKRRDMATKLATNIINMPGKYSRWDYDKAVKELGDYGISIVKQVFNSYSSLCDILTEDNEGMYKAQVRDYIISNIRLKNDSKKLVEITNNNKKCIKGELWKKN